MLNQISPLDTLFQALADPTRRGIVERLAQGPQAVSELGAGLPISLPAVMQHLGVLQAAGLVDSRKTGRVRMVWLNPAALQRLGRWAQAQQAMWETRLDGLGDYLDETDAKD